MRLQTVIHGFLALSCLSVLSCGGDGRKPLDSTSSKLVLQQLKTQFAAIPQSNTAPTMVSGLSGVSVSALRTHAVSCYSVNPDPATDADGDGIAAIKTYTMDCSNEAMGGVTITQKGVITYRDLDETVKGVYGGMRGDFSLPLFKVVDPSTGFAFNFTHSGFWEYKNVAGKLVSSSDYTGSFSGEEHSYKMDYSYSQKWNYVMTPDSTAKAFDKGKMEMSGSFGMKGDFVVEVDNKHQPYSGTWIIDFSTKDLVYDSACSLWYKSGSFVISDSANKLEIVYACTTSKLYVNGSESNWWTP